MGGNRGNIGSRNMYTKSQIDMEVTYYINAPMKKMLKVISPLQADLLVVFGRDLNQPFDHRHTRVTYPSAVRQAEELKDMEPSTPEAWELLMNEYLQVNKVKLERMNEYRQRKFEKGEKLI
jgi:hypothetical protein